MNRITSRRTATAAASLGIVALAASFAGCAATGSEAVDASCTPAHEFSTVTAGTLTVAAYNFPPHAVIDGDTLTGVEGDLLAEVAAMECLTVTLDSAGGSGAAVPSVQAGRADLAAADWWRTKARAELVSLSAPLYLDQGAIVSVDGYETIADLEGKKIGSAAGNLWNDDFTKEFGTDFAVYQDPEAAFSDLAAGRIDAVIDSVGATTARFESNPVEGATIVAMEPDESIPASQKPGQLNWPTNKGNPELTKAIDEDIETLHEDGTIAEILKKYGLDPSAAETGEPYEL